MVAKGGGVGGGRNYKREIGVMDVYLNYGDDFRGMHTSRCAKLYILNMHKSVNTLKIIQLYTLNELDSM